MKTTEILGKSEKGSTWVAKRAAKRAMNAISERAAIDAELYKRKRVFEGSLASAAQSAANSIRHIDSILMEYDIPERDLANARKMLLSAINLMVHSGISKKRD